MAQWQEFLKTGWTKFAWDADIAAWADHALPQARASVKDPANAQWMDCEGTWFIGVDALNNDSSGRLPGGPALRGVPFDFIAEHIGEVPELHRAQVSIVFPGYPRPRDGEQDAAFRYRARRDAAHVDGVKMYGTQRMRRVEEPHAWVIGLALNDSPLGASPLVVWEGSHEIMRQEFARVFSGVAPENWHLIDVTDVYKAARAKVFETCPRVLVHARPGEAYLMHRLCLHGVASWTAAVDEGAAGRAIAYFRPDLAGGVAAWLQLA